ncbi:MAG: ABC transporter ATP-binding protein/permease [Sphaerochaeta sp.]|jgi:ATP-binding cassette subfamily B multidrug efflux pump|nr:ABC transporter ATP-binding protein/permease [Sphaerochaeta sp.]MCI2045973.1 ABC transporter ATP-binding protein/permease [Sphaerochaeta sp.]MCI2097033.1 ABC transporter ATP-binding protein/permease [Sphaerochaeta sp.]MCI2103839.1 ABC transporter ATP-binding protein/permease [Sphaerochaeta sp.]
MNKTLLKRVREYRKDAIITPIMMIGEVAMEVAIPALMAEVIDQGVMQGNMHFLSRISIILIGAAMLSLLFGVLGGITASRASCGFAKNLRHDLFYTLQDFSFHNIDGFSTSSLITRMTTDVQNVQNAFQMVIRICFRAPIMFIFALLMVVRNGGRLAMVFLVAIPVIALGMFLIMRRVYPAFTRAFTSYDHLNRVVEENVTGIRAVKAYVRETNEEERFKEANDQIHDNFVIGQKLTALASPLMMGTTYASILALSWLGAHSIVAGSMTTGELMSVISYTIQILMSLMMISMIVVMLAISRASEQRITQVLETKTDMDTNPNGLTQVADGSVDFDHVDFSYGGKGGALCLHDINLHITSGQTIGILGNTGSGKSTLVSLMARLYDVTSGSVKVGGTDVREYELHSLRDAVSMVLQKNQLFSGTVAGNIRWGNQEATDEEVIQACRIAQASEFIEQLPDGYNAHVEQGGSNFSGGQKQRLCIARAILKKPKVVVFDDSTSAVDTKTDQKIREALAAYAPETTKIVISQRIASVENADRIFILDNGTIADSGTHMELLGRNALYASLYRTQNKVAANA